VLDALPCTVKLLPIPRARRIGSTTSRNSQGRGGGEGRWRGGVLDRVVGGEQAFAAARWWRLSGGT